jgi:hypothetical protein
MTNGEKLKEIFPSIELYEKSHDAIQINFDSVWWNTEYKEPTIKNDKVDCEHTDCNNCVNHKYCDYEPTTKNDLEVDCIDRQIISDYVESHIQEINTGYGDLNRHTNSILRIIVDYIENMPSVTPLKEQEPKKGKWLAIRTKDDTHEMTCSCCGYVVVELINRRITEETALEHLKDRIDENKFCPNCGAKMEKSEG